jgi:hypothetical protein
VPLTGVGALVANHLHAQPGMALRHRLTQMVKLSASGTLECDIIVK